MPVFRSRQQGELLAAVLSSPGEEHSLTDLARRIGAALSTVQREVTRLEVAGVLRSRRVGNVRLVQANRGSPAYEPLAALAERYFGAPAVLREEFARVAHIDQLMIFGSWAARLVGEPGPQPTDIDVLAVGIPDRDDAYAAALRVERRLGRPVNVTIRSAGSWEAAKDGFVRQVKSSPTVDVLAEGKV
jgi:DNA-binding transcriptional ArsR family regulator